MATQKKLAEHLDLSDRQIRNLVSDGVLPGSKGRGGYQLDACRKAYIRYLRGLQNGQIKAATDVDTARMLNLEADTRLKEIKRKQLEKELAPINLLEWTIGNAASQIAAILETIPGKLKRRAPRLSANELDIIKREIVKAQNIASKITVDLDGFQEGG